MRRRACLAALAAAALVALAALPSAHARSTRDVTVMTRNLFLGVDIRRAAGPQTREELQALAVQLVREVGMTDPAARMNLVAGEIARVKPDLVGLQEVTYWQLGSTKIDYGALLMRSLLRRGLAYRLVGGQVEADASLPTSAGQGRFRLGDAILVRRGIGASHIRHRSFRSQIAFPIATGTVPVHRGWDELDADVGGARLHFVNTHLEAFSAAVRLDQARELVAGPLSRRGQIVLVGDLNSNANLAKPEDRPPFLAIRGAGFVVRQTSRHGCCWHDDLKTGRLDHTIDFVMTRPPVPLVASGLTGVSERTRVGTHAADHSGVWSRLRLPL